MITEPYNKLIPIVTDKSKLENTMLHIDTVYKQIKKNEHSPKTDYLFTGLNNNNSYQKSLQRMELMNSMDIV